MEYAITTPAGRITVDHTYTKERVEQQLRALGLVNKCLRNARINRPEASLIQAAARLRGLTEDEWIERFQRRHIDTIPSQRQNGAFANPR